jgi:hypothetical protein
MALAKADLMRTLRFSLFLLLLAQAAVAPEVLAQGGCPGGCQQPTDLQVVGVSFILAPWSGEVNTYSATEMGATVAAYYDAGGDTYLRAGEAATLVTSGSLGEGNPVAEGSLSAAAGASQYELNTNHYLFAADSVDDDGGQWCDPLGFGESGGGGQNVMTVNAPYTEADDVSYVSNRQINLGNSWDFVYAPVPVIYSIVNDNGTAGWVTVNSQGTLDITGVGLTASGSDPSPAVGVTPTQGLSLTNATPAAENGDSELRVSYNATSAGTYSITVTTNAGTSNAYSFTVGDPTPAITSISPSTWNAGAAYGCSNPVAIGGTGFGTNPTPSITGPGITWGQCGAYSDTMIRVWVNVGASFSPGTAVITVQSNGYNGTPFLAAQTGQTSTSVPQTVPIIPIAADAPTIILGPNTQGGSKCLGSDTTGSTQSVVVGQQIAFTGCLPATVSLSDVTSVSWTPVSPPGTAIGGYSATTNQGNVLPLSSPSCSAGQSYCDFPAFYWVDQGNSRQFTFTYTLCCGGGSKSARVTFNVDGPTGVKVTGPNGATVGNNQPPMAPANVVKIQNLGVSYAAIELGTGQNDPNTYGIVLQASATHLPNGAGANSTYVWVQLISNDHILQRLRATGGTQSCVPNGFVTAPNTPELDGAYPHMTGFYMDDSPITPLADDTSNLQKFAELAQNFAASTYLMWDPALPTGCLPASVTIQGVSTPSQCQSIPIPLGSVQWSWCGDAIDTLDSSKGDNATTWKLWCGSPSAGTTTASSFQASGSYPQWSSYLPSNVSKSQAFTCQDQ